MIRYTKIWDRDLGGKRYRVSYTGRDRFGANVGVVRCPARDSATEPWVWQYSVDGESFTRLSRTVPNRRLSAANALLRIAGLPAQAAPASAPRRARTGRAFGVEIELTGPSSGLIQQALEAHGINVNNRGTYGGTNGGSWELKHDGSVSGHALELASPKLRGEAGMRELETVCTALAEVGATVDRTCGLHVHHDARGLTAEQIKRQVLAFVERQGIIRRMVAPSRRPGGSNTYAPEWGESHIATLRRFDTGRFTNLRDIAYVGPRGCINLQSYARHGSVEIRYHGGTTSFRKMSAWIRFGQALFVAAEAQVALPTDTPDNLLGALRSHGLTVEDSATLLRFDRVGLTRREVEATIREANEMLQEVQ